MFRRGWSHAYGDVNENHLVCCGAVCIDVFGVIFRQSCRLMEFGFVATLAFDLQLKAKHLIFRFIIN